jgi:sugar (pentulose or hexulose) kinase
VETKGDFILSFDLGTTALKVGLFSHSGGLLRLATREQLLHFPGPNRVEQSLTETWRLACEATTEVLAQVEVTGVKAVVLTSQRGSVVPMDDAGSPLSNLLVWMDHRGLGQVTRLHATVGAADYYCTSGHPIVPITGVSKVLWLHAEAREIWEKTSAVGSPQTLFLRWLGCEEALIDYSSGSYLFPCDIRARQWSQPIAGALAFPLEKLPRLVPATSIVGQLSSKAARQLHLPSGIPIVAGGGDGQCAAAGTGVVFPGSVMVNIGTAAGVQVFLPEPIFDPAHTLNCAAHVVPGAWEMEGHTQASGTVFRWFRDQFGGAERLVSAHSGHETYDLLIDQAAGAPAGSDELLFLPTFNGSTAPIVDSSARGALIGLRLSHTRSHVIRALLEGISLEIRWMLDAMAAAGIQLAEIRLAGGGSRNPLWNQIHADVFNRPVRTVSDPDAALVGGAMCAAVALGVYPDFPRAAEAFVRLGPTIEPLATNAAIYERTYARYVRVFKLLSEQRAFALSEARGE